MSWINVSFSIPYWLPTSGMVAAWCLLAMAEVLLCAVNAVLFDLRCQTAAAAFRNRQNDWWKVMREPLGFRPGPAASFAHLLTAFALWPIGLPKEIKTFVFQLRLDWQKDAERLERETRKPRRTAA